MRLAEIAKIEPGWLDGDGKAVTATALRIARLLIASPPRVYPTPEGGVSLEWDDAIVWIGPRGGVEFISVPETALRAAAKSTTEAGA